MRWLLSLIFVMVTLSSASATETKTEFITEEVCHAVAGCWVNVKTGECPDCVTETRKVVTVIEKEKPIESIVKLEKPIESIVKKELVKTKVVSNLHGLYHYRRASFKDIKRMRKANRPKWTCVVGTCDFIDKNGNLKG